MERISACIVLYNNENTIKTCLDNIKNVVNEIIIVHDGECTDNTLEICKKYTNKIFIRSHIGEAEPQRPFAFSKSTGNWILWIDADEQLSTNLKENIRKLVENSEYNGHTFLWDVYQGIKKVENGYFSKVRKLALFRKSAMLKYYGIPNECLRVRGKVKATNYRIIHNQQGERNTLRAFNTRTIEITKIHAEQLIKNHLVNMPAIFYFFKAPAWFVAYLAYYLINGAFLTKQDRVISFLLALYNFYVYWYVFKLKI